MKSLLTHHPQKHTHIYPLPFLEFYITALERDYRGNMIILKLLNTKMGNLKWRCKNHLTHENVSNISWNNTIYNQMYNSHTIMVAAYEHNGWHKLLISCKNEIQNVPYSVIPGEIKIQNMQLEVCSLPCSPSSACQNIAYFLYWTWRFITMFTNAHHWTLSWASWIQQSVSSWDKGKGKVVPLLN